MSTDIIKIGTRSSKLALWQANHVAGLLEENGIRSEILAIETKGDKVLDVSISKIGSKGVFTEELEDKLRSGEIDVAIHSAKDLQSNLSSDFEIIAFCQREAPQDVVLSNKTNINLDIGPIKIGTSSTRRVALFRNYYPHIELVNMRGNLQTRISKMENGACDALVLAYAGVHRMRLDHLIKKHLDLKQFVPAVGQGSIAIEASTSLSTVKRELLRETVNDWESETCIKAERAFLKRLEGGCSIPVFGLAKANESSLTLNAGIISLDGTEKIQIERKGGSGSPEKVGLQVAEEILSMGGDRILKDIKRCL